VNRYLLRSYVNDVSHKHFDLHIVLVCGLKCHINVDGGSIYIGFHRWYRGSITEFICNSTSHNIAGMMV
jgi:hypothetical protein